jgi:hypothetical protein
MLCNARWNVSSQRLRFLFTFFASVSVATCILWILWTRNFHISNISWNTSASHSLDTTNSANTTITDIAPVQVTQKPPKITIIAIWVGRDGERNYLKYFFESVEANPNINLLFVNVLRDEDGCQHRSNASNIQMLCLKEPEYYQLHVDFLCNKWNCSEEQKNTLFEHIYGHRMMDFNFSFFRILRSGIFAKWIDPATTIWGWCDLDTYWGKCVMPRA